MGSEGWQKEFVKETSWLAHKARHYSPAHLDGWQPAIEEQSSALPSPGESSFCLCCVPARHVCSIILPMVHPHAVRCDWELQYWQRHTVGKIVPCWFWRSTFSLPCEVPQDNGVLMSISEVILPLRARAHVFIYYLWKPTAKTPETTKRAKLKKFRLCSWQLFQVYRKLATASTFPASVDGNRAFEGQILTFIPKQIKKAYSCSYLGEKA